MIGKKKHTSPHRKESLIKPKDNWKGGGGSGRDLAEKIFFLKSSKVLDSNNSVWPSEMVTNPTTLHQSVLLHPCWTASFKSLKRVVECEKGTKHNIRISSHEVTLSCNCSAHAKA